eukprot:gnl/TRDRNA2_/TRDRNA2_90671_c0_seq1.p1 gnl/TRDRNA2_/TRDRNA2_90671_c0~~gnl/TRDRNA2_/TRDRNA2_90671_c0_seq1.p1  ORF type:complete len:233 (+),score=15.98 gnl/TRDRNA2_/TRDRNA2_90671_c0_seq1:110-808(+)
MGLHCASCCTTRWQDDDDPVPVYICTSRWQERKPDHGPMTNFQGAGATPRGTPPATLFAMPTGIPPATPKSKGPKVPVVGTEILLSPPGAEVKHWGDVIATRLELSINVDFGGDIGVQHMEPSQWKQIEGMSDIGPHIGMKIEATPQGHKAKYSGIVVATYWVVLVDVDFGGEIGLKSLEPAQWKVCTHGRDHPSLTERCACGKILALCKKCKKAHDDAYFADPPLFPGTPT